MSDKFSWLFTLISCNKHVEICDVSRVTRVGVDSEQVARCNHLLLILRVDSLSKKRWLVNSVLVVNN